MYSPPVTAKELGSPTPKLNGGAGKVFGVGFLTVILILMIVVLVATLGNRSSGRGQYAVSDEERQAAQAIVQKLTSGGLITRQYNTAVYVSERWHSLSRQQKVGLGACLLKTRNNDITIRDDRTGKELAKASSSGVEIIGVE